MGDRRTRDPTTGRSASDNRDSPNERSAFTFHQASGDEGVPELVRRLADQGSRLAQQQMQLVEAEIRSGIADIKASVGAMAGAAVLGLTGLGVTLMGVAFLLSEAMPLWAATLIVGVATLGIAYVMFASGKGKLESSSLELERSRHTIERAPRAISGNEDTHHGR